MKRVSLTILVFVTSLIVISACKKSNKIGTGGGNGGNATLLIIPEHHGQFVDTCRLYIKFGTLDAPANGVYDDSSSCVLNDTTPVAVFPHLTKGIYYVYGIGFHALYTPPNVKGGGPITISVDDTNTFYLPTYTYYP